MDSDIALKNFLLTNDIKEFDPQDTLFDFDNDSQQKVVKEEPWAKDPHYFKSVKISAVALIKMVIHARSGGIYEIMGLMSGKVDGNTMIIMDSFALPVQGTETRVNAQNEANEYMVQYIEASRQAGHKESIIGWYHSHPGYGCWLSGIDVNTQSTNQKYQDPFVAVVIDPNRTISAGKVDIGAFRTYPEGYKPPNASTEYQSIPLSKIEDFGVHANQYYPMEIEIFKSKLDEDLLRLLWNKYWVNTLSSSPLISNRAYAVSQLHDLAAKLGKATSAATQKRTNPENLVLPQVQPQQQGPKAAGSVLSDAMIMSPPPSLAKGKAKEQPGFPPSSAQSSATGQTKPPEENALTKAVRDSTKIASEAQHGLISQMLKDIIFSNRPQVQRPESGEGGASTEQVESAVETAMAS